MHEEIGRLEVPVSDAGVPEPTDVTSTPHLASSMSARFVSIVARLAPQIWAMPRPGNMSTGPADDLRFIRKAFPGARLAASSETASVWDLE